MPGREKDWRADPQGTRAKWHPTAARRTCWTSAAARPRSSWARSTASSWTWPAGRASACGGQEQYPTAMKPDHGEGDPDPAGRVTPRPQSLCERPAEIADMTGGTLEGDGSCVITGAAGLQEAGLKTPRSWAIPNTRPCPGFQRWLRFPAAGGYGSPSPKAHGVLLSPEGERPGAPWQGQEPISWKTSTHSPRSSDHPRRARRARRPVDTKAASTTRPSSGPA